MNFRHMILPTTLAALLALTVGCEWTGTSSDEAWNDAYSWVNFSGSYRLYNAISPTDDSTDTTEQVQYAVKKPQTVESNGGANYSGTLANRPVVEGSVTLYIGPATLTDQGDGTLAGINNNKISGSINYITGAWSANTSSEVVDGSTFRATYAYKVTGTVTVPGQAGSAITTVNVNQKGNLLTMTDNQGVVYEGRVTGASVPSDTLQAGNIRLNFEVKAGNGAKIIGTLSGDWTGGEYGTLSNRSLLGTYWKNKNSVDLQGASGSISITPLPLTSN